MNIYTPYTYLITFLPTGQRYYGVRTKRGCHPTDLWNSYYTSSKEVRQLIKQHGCGSFTTEIRRTFRTREQAIAWEHRVLRRLDAACNPQYLNRNNGDRKFYGGGVPVGFKHTEDAKQRMSINSSGSKNPNWGGKAFTGETRRKLSEARKGFKESPEVVAAKRERMKGENNPNYGKKFHWWNDGTRNSLVEQCPGEGWVRGRLWADGHRAKMEASRHKKGEHH
jgi:hypothetical protein